jgi:uncharacterized protein DUF3179
MRMTSASAARERTRAGFLNRKAAWFILFLLAAIALAFVAIPVWLIMPFKSQTPGKIEIAYALKRFAPLVTAIGSALAFALAYYLWRGARRWRSKAILALPVLLMLASAWFARQNHFEWMFNPLPNASFARTSDAGFVADSDQVLAVQINDEAAAYPIRQIAYHHVIQDEVGGSAIAATY